MLKMSPLIFVDNIFKFQDYIIDLVGKKLDPRSLEYKEHVQKMSIEKKQRKKATLQSKKSA